MFEAFDPDRDFSSDRFVSLPGSRDRRASATSRPSEAVLTVLEAGFKARVMSWQSAYDLGARSNLPRSEMTNRTEICAKFIRAGLGCAVDETLFAALVYHYSQVARDLSKQGR